MSIKRIMKDITSNKIYVAYCNVIEEGRMEVFFPFINIQGIKGTFPINKVNKDKILYECPTVEDIREKLIKFNCELEGSDSP
jgi:hypothetical protein